MKTRIFLVIAALIVVSIMPAALIIDAPLTFVQPDGQQIDILASGDEFHNWLHDKDGYTIIQDQSSGWYVYAERDGESVRPGNLRVGLQDPKLSPLEKGINLSPALIKEKYDRLSHMRDYSNGRSPHTGQFNNLVVFIKFADDPDFMHPISYYDDMFNAVGENANSQRNYFLEASYQQLTVDSFYYPPPNGSTIVTYIDPQPRNYYRPISVNNPIGYDPNDDYERGIREQTMLANSIAYVENMIPVDLVIDGDGDGYVDNVCFVIQGQPDGWAELLWPHRWVMYYVQSYIRGARVWDFNLQLESFLGSSGASVLAHELFHSLGAPDLYRYYDSTITPIGQWDLMAGNSNPPQHMSVWMKHRYGEWIDNVPYITQSGTYTLSPVASSSTNNIYRVASWRSFESYVIEYRKGHGLYDHNLPGSGILVYRLDTRESGNASGPPDELYIYRPNANNTTTNGVLSQAFYNAAVGRTKISETTIPSGFTRNNTAGGLNIYDIGQAGETISFSIKVSDIQLTYPIGGETWFSGSNKNITWQAKSMTGNVSIQYTLDGGQNWTMLASSTPNDGSFTWMGVPYINTNEASILITLLSNSNTDTCYSSFSIISEVSHPEPVFPENNATGVVTNPVITWNPVFGANSYQFQLSTDEYFDSYIHNTLDYQSTTFSLPSLQPFTDYYWRVATISDIGISEFCPTQTFQTGDISVVPVYVTLDSPANMATNQPMNPVLSWIPTPTANSYHLQIGINSLFANDMTEYFDIENTSIRLEGLLPNTLYFWRVRASNVAGYGYFSSIRRFTTGDWVSNSDELIQIPVATALAQNYPNPFNPNTSISFQIKDLGQDYSLTVYNTKGQVVRNLASGTASTHKHTVNWNGTDDNGRAVSSGLYFYKLQAGEYNQTKKMLLMK